MNDLNEFAIQEYIPTILKNRLSVEDNPNKIDYDLGDCFDILTRRPELKGKVNAIMVQNVEHFFNPEQHQQFLMLLLLFEFVLLYLKKNKLKELLHFEVH